MAFRGKYNMMAIKLGMFCYSYFKIKYGECKVITEYPDGTISILDGGNEYGKTAAKCHYAIVNCYLAIGDIDKATLHSDKLNEFNDSYVLNDNKKIFFSDLAKISIEKFKNIN